MLNSQNPPQIPLPKGWKKHVRSGILHVLSLAQYAVVYTRSWAEDGVNQRVRLKAEIDRLTQEIVRLREEIRIKDARLRPSSSNVPFTCLFGNHQPVAAIRTAPAPNSCPAG